MPISLNTDGSISRPLCVLLRSFVRSFVRPFVRPFVRSFVCSVTRKSVVWSFGRSVVRSLQIPSFTLSTFVRFVRSFVRNEQPRPERKKGRKEGSQREHTATARPADRPRVTSGNIRRSTPTAVVPYSASRCTYCATVPRRCGGLRNVRTQSSSVVVRRSFIRLFVRRSFVRRSFVRCLAA